MYAHELTHLKSNFPLAESKALDALVEEMVTLQQGRQQD